MTTHRPKLGPCVFASGNYFWAGCGAYVGCYCPGTEQLGTGYQLSSATFKRETHDVHICVVVFVASSC